MVNVTETHGIVGSLIFAKRLSVKQYLTEILICISLTTNEVSALFYIFMCIYISFPCEMTVGALCVFFPVVWLV